MPVQKFDSLSEIGKIKKLEPGTPEFRNALHSVFWMAKKFAPPQNFPPGVYKFRDIEQAQAQKKAWARAAQLIPKLNELAHP
jgi:hypothetical protein